MTKGPPEDRGAGHQCDHITAAITPTSIMDDKLLNFMNLIDPEKPVLLAGPTASGKSALAMRIAERTGGAIVNADALQVYACWRVLTARPSEADEAALPHRLYGHVHCDHSYSVGQWLRDLAPLLQAAGPPPVIVGGTGLYFTALTGGLAPIPAIPQKVRAQAMAADPARLLAELDRDDPATARSIDRRNPARIRRAWEVLRATGTGLAAWKARTPPPLLPAENATRLLLNPPKEVLNARIATRFRQMIDQGALDECRRALPDWDPARPSAQAIGAAQLIAHLRGEMPLDAAIAAAITATRRYAKRQRSWFRSRMADWQQPGFSTGNRG